MREWTHPVEILHAGAVAEDASQAQLGLTMRADDGAVVWYTLEAWGGGELCAARAHALELAPNLTLAADDDWLEHLNVEDVVRT